MNVVRRLILLVAGAALAGACSKESSSGAPGSAAQVAPAATVVACDTDPIAFPSFSKTCATTADCILGVYRADCCNGRAAIGLAKSEVARFEAAKSTCEQQFEARKCPSCAVRPPTRVEDGTANARDENLGLECRKGQCMSVARVP